MRIVYPVHNLACMLSLNPCKIETDIDFFRALHRLYATSTYRYKKILSFKKPVAVRFVKVRLHSILRNIDAANSVARKVLPVSSSAYRHTADKRHPAGVAEAQVRVLAYAGGN
jgi:hypothetical protein